MLNPQLWIHSAITFLSSLAGTGVLMEKNDIHSHIGAIVNSCPQTSNGFQDCTVSLYFLDTELFIVVFPKYFHFSQIPNFFIPQFCLFLNTKVGISKVFFSFFLSFFAAPCDIQDLSSPAKGWTLVPCGGNKCPTTRQPGNFQCFVFINTLKL